MSAPVHCLALRPECPADESLLFDLYASTRAEELDALNWPAEARAAFLDLQFRAQRQGYRAAFPDAQFLIVQQNGQPVGRMVVDRGDAEIRLVDLAILSPHRNAGLGTGLLRDLISEAKAAGKPLRLKVLPGSRSTRLYQRLGFVKIADLGLHEEMEWRS